MHAAIRKYKIKPGKANEIASRAQKEFVPIIQGLPGYIGYYGVVGENDTMATVSIFQDKAGEEESTRRAAEWIKSAGLGSLIEGPPEIVAGNVAWKGSK